MRVFFSTPGFRRHSLALLALLAGSAAMAQDVGRVLSSTPVMQQVGVPRQVCGTEQVAIQAPKSGAGAAIGAIAGGAMGNAVGRGAGQAAATMIGIVGGAIVGDRIEGAPAPQVQNVQRCTMQTFYENRPVAYNVVYEYAGKQYTVQMPSDPGPTIALQVAPVGASGPATPPAPMAAMPPPVAAVTYSQPVYVQPQQVFVAQSPYPVYYPRPYYAPIQLNLGYGYWGGHGMHRHWR